MTERLVVLFVVNRYVHIYPCTENCSRLIAGQHMTLCSWVYRQYFGTINKLKLLNTLTQVQPKRSFSTGLLSMPLVGRVSCKSQCHTNDSQNQTFWTIFSVG